MKLSVLVSLVPGGGTPSSARNPLDGSVGRNNFGSLLSGMTDASGTTPAINPGAPSMTEATGSADGFVPDSDGNGEAGSLPGMSSSVHIEPPLLDVAAATTPQIAGFARASGSPGVNSLLTLATRAAGTARSGTASASDPTVVLTAAPGAKNSVSADGGARPSGRVVRKTFEPDDGDDKVGTVTDTVKPTPVAGFVAATGALVPATVSFAADAIQKFPGADALRSTRAPAPKAGNRPTAPFADVSLPLAETASGSSLALPTITAPTSTVGEIGTAPVEAGTADHVDAAILPGTVRVESHLGFDRGGAVDRPQTPRSVATSGAQGKDEDSSLSEGERALGVPHAALDSAAAEAAAASPSHSAIARDDLSSNDAEPVMMLPNTPLGTEGVDAASPVASRSRPASAAAISPSASAERLAASSAPLVPEVNGAADGSSRSASTDAVSSDQVGRFISPSTRPETDEPNPLAKDTAVAMPAMPIAAIVAPTPQASPPVALQVADGIAGLASTVVPDETGPGTPVAPARTMALQLSPAGLGTLNVRLHVAGRALDVHLEASDTRTAALIDRERETLSVALRGKDYELQTLSVTTHDATMPGATHAERGTDPGSPDTGQSGGGSFGGRSGDGRAREEPDRAARPSSRTAKEIVVEHGGSSLFV